MIYAATAASESKLTRNAIGGAIVSSQVVDVNWYCPRLKVDYT